MRVIILMVCVGLWGCTRASDALPTAGESNAALIDLLAQTNAKVEQFRISPDGRQIAYVSSKNGSSDIWVMNADGSQARAITDAAPEAEADPQWSPDGQWIAYATRHCGTDCWTDIFMTKADGSTAPIDLTYGRGGPNPRWTPDGRSIVFVRYYGDSGFSQIGLVAAQIPYGRPQVRWLTDWPASAGEPQVSPDGKWLALTTTRSERPAGPAVNGIWVMPMGGGGPRLVAGGADTPQWSPDSTQIAFVSGDGEWRNIGVVELASGVRRMLTSDTWDNGNPQWSPDGQSLAYVANQQWNFHVMTVAARGGTPRQLTDRAGVSAGWERANVRGTFRWTPDSQSIVYTFTNHALASDLWQMPASGGPSRQLTNHMPAALLTDRFVAPELVTYKSTGDVEVSAFLFKPKNQTAGEKPPLLLYAHSFGGGGMFVNGFYPFVNYFVDRGYVVLAAEDAGRNELGGLDIDDYSIAGIEYLDRLGLIDRDRVVMQGGSTGGYRTMQTAVRFPDVLKAAVNLYGPTNVPSLHEFYKGTRRRFTFGAGDTSKPPEYWRERSSTFNVGRMKTPILLLFADRDLGVPTSQADEFVRLARDKGLPTEYVAYANESHGWYNWRPDTLKDALKRVAAHYDKYLRDE
jgi:dipeptidyl aminopeptidase/acylaminoacyl peptidase